MHVSAFISSDVGWLECDGTEHFLNAGGIPRLGGRKMFSTNPSFRLEVIDGLKSVSTRELAVTVWCEPLSTLTFWERPKLPEWPVGPKKFIFLGSKAVVEKVQSWITVYIPVTPHPVNNIKKSLGIELRNIYHKGRSLVAPPVIPSDNWLETDLDLV